jgi:hypothetical protein
MGGRVGMTESRVAAVNQVTRAAGLVATAMRVAVVALVAAAEVEGMRVRGSLVAKAGRRRWATPTLRSS